MPTRRTFDKAEFLPNDNSTPHIVPDVLYPAIGGKLLDGTTSHSGDYGTAQSSDSRKYYYTDIKGSRPIRDPRIGAHFGSQRHKFKSLQLLEQETATHGEDIKSVDGREWIRTIGNYTLQNNTNGSQLYSGASSTPSIEITGYFSSLNLIGLTLTSDKGLVITIDGVSGSEVEPFLTSVSSPLGPNRYVDRGSVANVVTGQTLGIHTVKITDHANADENYHYGIELIAQDTTNAVTRNKIQIPSQTVFSFGSKFTVGGSSAATHYDPFSAKSDGTGWTSPTSGTNTPNSSAAWPSNIDTATSLGLAKWISGTNYYRPYNGGRVVKWVDENGEIKTSVNVMPPNAKSIGDSGTLSNGTAKSNGSAPNDNFRPTFEAHTSSADEDLLSEVAKTFHYREFGNGAANQGTGGTYADVSMLNTNDDVAYVMDDGLTSFSGRTADYSATHGLWIDSDNHSAHLTFIGTGVGWDSGANGKNTWAQNLPYGTHIVHYYAGNHHSSAYIAIDGIQVKSDFSSSGGNDYIYNWAFGGASGDITFHQPKMPPIPEGACIIADYMLMADYVPQTVHGIDKVSKGVRESDCSRDIFFDSANSGINSGFSLRVEQTAGFGFASYHNSSNTHIFKQEFFGEGILFRYWESSSTYRQATFKLFVDDTLLTASNFPDVTVSSPYFTYSSSAGTFTQVSYVSGAGYYVSIKGLTLGHHTLKYSHDATADTQQGKLSSFDIATPIHTSHHYKSFETPFLHELIGGDRNMEQTHLICSADGKTWDEVTRDTSYIGNKVVHCSLSSTVTSMQEIKFDEWRGSAAGNEVGTALMNKDFAIAYDRIICLRDGEYTISASEYINASAAEGRREIKVNGSIAASMYTVALNTNNVVLNPTLHLKRGDYVQYRGCFYGNYGQFSIVRVR